MTRMPTATPDRIAPMPGGVGRCGLWRRWRHAMSPVPDPAAFRTDGRAASAASSMDDLVAPQQRRIRAGGL
jgi:hypothetical protein